MEKSFRSVFNIALELTRNYFWRIFGMFFLIAVISLILGRIPYFGALIEMACSGLLSLGLFLSLYEIETSGKKDISLLDHTSQFVFKKEIALTYFRYLIANLAIFLLGVIPAAGLILFRITSSGGGFTPENMTSLFSNFDFMIWGLSLFAILYVLLISAPAGVFAAYLGVLKLAPTMSEAFKKSFNVFYEHWLLFLQLAIFELILPCVVGMLCFGVYYQTGSATIPSIIGVVSFFIYSILLIPFNICLNVALVRVIFSETVQISSAPINVDGSSA